MYKRQLPDQLELKVVDERVDTRRVLEEKPNGRVDDLRRNVTRHPRVDSLEQLGIRRLHDFTLIGLSL